MRVSILGGAGFIGSHLANHLVRIGHEVDVIDSGYAVYGTALTAARSSMLAEVGIFVDPLDLSTVSPLDLKVRLAASDVVVHLAAWPGVRQSVVDPFGYTRNNVFAFANVLEATRLLGVPLLYASSSSIYGDKAISGACRESDADGYGLKSHYSMTKWIDEELTTLRPPGSPPAVGMRFFTVFGPWGRPDMAYFIFARLMLEGRPLPVFGGLDVTRDFTYVDDTVGYVSDLMAALLSEPSRVVEMTAQPSGANVVNVCNGQAYSLSSFLERLAASMGLDYDLDVQPASPLDARATLGDPTLLRAVTGSQHYTDATAGIGRFAEWAAKYEDNLNAWSN